VIFYKQKRPMISHWPFDILILIIEQNNFSVSSYVARVSRYVSLYGSLFSVPTQGTTCLVFRHSGFEEIFLFAQV